MGKPQPGDTKKKGKKLYRLSSSGKWFKSSNSKKAEKQRALNARLDAPIATLPGTNYQSQLTERDLAHQANAATLVRYGGAENDLRSQLGLAQQQQRNTGHWYDEYRAQLAAAQQQNAVMQQQYAQAQAALPGLVQGLGQQTQGVENQAQQQNQAVTGLAPVPQASGAANAVGQGVAANWAALAQNTANANNQFSGTMANVVAPQQKLVALKDRQQAVTDVAKKQGALKAEEGQFNQQFRSDQRSNEQKNLLASATLGLQTAKAQADAKNNSPGAKTAAAFSTSEARQAAKYGYNLHDWRMLGPTGRTKAMQKFKTSSAKKGGETVYSSGPFAGHTQSEIQGMSQSQRQSLIDKANEKSGSKKKDGKGPAWVSPKDLNDAGSKAVRGASLARQIKSGHEISTTDAKTKQKTFLNKPGTKLNRSQAADFLRRNTSLDEALITASLDAAYVGHLSPYAVRKLIAAGYKPSKISGDLGVPTRKGMKKTKPTGAAAYPTKGGVRAGQ